MKKCLLMVGMLLVSFVVTAATEVMGSITWTYTVTNGEATLLTCRDEDGSVYLPTSGIPETFGGYPVVAIADKAFYRYSYPYRDRQHDQSIDIPKTVRRIGNEAFCDCQCLVSIKLNEGLEEIGDGAFCGCRLAIIDGIPSTVRKIGTRAFSLTKIYNLVIPEGVLDIPERAFYKCKNLSDIPLPSTVTNIGASAFAYAPVGRMDFPSALRRIGDMAFYWCLNLTNVTFSGMIPTLGSQSFKECDGLADANGLVIVGDVLYDAPLTGEVIVSAGVKTVGDYAFYPQLEINDDYHDLPDHWTSHNRASLFSSASTNSTVTSVVFRGAVEKIGEMAFMNCQSLSSLTFAGAPPIGLDAAGLKETVEIRYPAIFGTEWGCVMDESVFTNIVAYVPPDGGPFTEVVDGVEWLYVISGGLASLGGDSHSAKAVSESVSGELHIPDILGACPVVRIGDYAFYERANITDITIPASVTNIGCLAFHKCSGLGEGVIVKDGCVLTVNGTCPQTVVLPQGTRIVGSRAFFQQNNLKYIYMPASMRRIEPEAFYWCENLECIVFDGDTAPSCSEISHVKAYCKAYVRANSVGWECDIPGTRNWNGISMAYFDVLTDRGVVTGYEGIVPPLVHIPNEADGYSVSKIADRAFYFCSKLTEISIATSVTNIGEEAFFKCPLQTVHVSEGDVSRVTALLTGSGFDVAGVTFVEDIQNENIYPVVEDDSGGIAIAAALSGSADARLFECITNAANYNAYREWAAKVKTSDGSGKAGMQTVKGSDNAWFSFAVGSDRLISELPTSEDIKVNAFAPSSESGKFDFTVSIDGVTVSEDALKENLKQVFGLEGSTSLDPDGFSPDNVDIDFGTPKDGKVKFIAGPKSGAANSGTFFMKVKITP